MLQAFIFTVLILLTSPARSEKFGDWNTGFGQGIAEYSIEKTDGDRMYISCGDKTSGPAVNIDLTLNGLDFPNNKSSKFIDFRVGENSGSLTFGEDGKLNTSCTACLSNYELFWRALRSGNTIEFETRDGAKTEFSLKGSTKAIPQEQCVTQIELEISEIVAAKKAKKTLQKTVAMEGSNNANIAEKTSGTCDIEDWKFSEKADKIYLNGTTTCQNGKMIFRLYDGVSGDFIGGDTAYIDGFVFQSFIDGVVPQTLKIKYVIEE